MNGVIEFKIFLYVVIVLSVVFHEYLHAWTANYLGDPTAKYAGRLTLNPLKHLDPVGTVILPLLLLFFWGGFIGWAKPVPYNPYNLRDPRYGSSKVAIAGPMSNFSIALFFGLILRFGIIFNFISIGGFFYIALAWIVFINIFLGLFNLIPIPPLDGSKILMDIFPQSKALQFLEQSFIGIFIAIIIAMTFLGPVAYLFYYLLVGGVFPGLPF